MPPRYGILDGYEDSNRDAAGQAAAMSPLAIIRAAKASLQNPTRPMTPAEGDRQLFARESEFAQNRPPSAYGIPNSQMFYDGRSKLQSAYSYNPDAGSLGTRKSILDSGDTWKTGSRSMQRTGSKGERDTGDLQWRNSGDAGNRLLSPQPSHTRPTPSQTVQALKASIAAIEMGYKSPNQLYDLNLPGTAGAARPPSAQGGTTPLYPRTPHEHNKGNFHDVQVLDVSHSQYSDSDSDDDAFSDNSSAYDHQAGDAEPAQPSLVVLDDSDEFLSWRVETDSALAQLAAATGSLLGGPGAGKVDKRAALAEVLERCSRVLACVVHAKKQAKASMWLNSSSGAYQDSRGQALRMREAISEHLFRLMDNTSPELLIKASAVILRVVRSRTPLLQAGKLLYRLSKDSSHDVLFRSDAVLEAMLHAIHVMVVSCDKSAKSDARVLQHNSSRGQGTDECKPGKPAPVAAQQSLLYEPLVYFCGALKNVSNDNHNQRLLVKAGAVHVLCKSLRSMLSHAKSATNQSAGSGPAQVAVQITGVLRNLAVSPAHVPAFLARDALAALKSTIQVLSNQQDLALNMGRVLSKLSLSDAAQVAFESDAEYAPLLVSLLEHYAQQGPMLLRLAFVLGNLTTTSDNYRQQVASVPGALDLIVNTLEVYVNTGRSSDSGSSTSSNQAASETKRGPAAQTQGQLRLDCIVKLLRLVANLAIHPKVGPGLAARPSLATCLLDLLDTYSFEGATEELVLNVVCAITNLSFYQTPDNQFLGLEPARLLRPITPLLLVDNEEAVVEAARAFGNLSRVPAAREFLVTARVLEALVLLLDHSSCEVLYSVCGTLINFSADASRQGELVQLGGSERLIEVLQRCAEAESPGDMEVATLCVVCKALFNLCAADTGSQLTESELAELGQVLKSVQASQVLMTKPEVPQVTTRLSTVLARLQQGK